MIMVTDKGLAKDADLAKNIDKAIFPGLQGGPHDHTTSAIAVALGEAMKPEFKEYGSQIVKNAKALAEVLKDNKIKVVTNGTDNHMLLIDLTPFGKGKGIFLQEALDLANVTVNKNTIPNEPSSPFYPSGIRLGTPALTSRGMKEEEMRLIGRWIADIIIEIVDFELGEDEEVRKNNLNKFREQIKNNKTINKIKKEVIALCEKFPLYPDMKY
jgi:glycine hydroxymethyltransferase